VGPSSVEDTEKLGDTLWGGNGCKDPKSGREFSWVDSQTALDEGRKLQLSSK